MSSFSPPASSTTFFDGADAIPSFTLATYNVNFGSFVNGPVSSEQVPGAALRVSEALLATRADVVLLQETNEGWQAFFSASPLLSQQYRTQHWLHPGLSGYFAAGSAILLNDVLFDLVDVHAIPTAQDVPGEYFDQLAALIRRKTDGKLIRLINVHLRPPLPMAQSEGSGVFASLKVYFSTSPDVHRSEIEYCLGHVRREYPDAHATVLAGDFNEGSKGGVGYLLELGFSTVLHRVAGNATTWYWPVIGGMSIFGQYDHIFFQDSELQIQNVQIYRDYRDASDHLPVSASFGMADLTTNQV